MSISNRDEGHARRLELEARERQEELAQEAARREDTGFVKVYDLGWRRLDDLMAKDATAARVYAFLARHIDGRHGAVIVSMNYLAKLLDVSGITIRRKTKYLEDEGAIVRIPLSSGVYAYCLNPEEVWRSWARGRDYAAFTTRTLISARGSVGDAIEAKLKAMMLDRTRPMMPSMMVAPPALERGDD